MLRVLTLCSYTPSISNLTKYIGGLLNYMLGETKGGHSNKLARLECANRVPQFAGQSLTSFVQFRGPLTGI